MSEKCCLCGCGTEKMPLVITDGGLYKHLNQAACEMAKSHELKLLQSQLSDAEKRNDLFSDCLRRALKLWQDKHPDYDGWPDGAVNLAWVLDQLTTAQEENKRYQSLMSKHIVGRCTQCNYMANWPVCTKCGTPYPDGMNELGEKQ
ncbi:MAG: hypothetical protein WC449_06360 [Candidatus Paceibacterota bacterium]